MTFHIAYFSKISAKEKGVIKHQAKIDCSLGKDISHNNKRKLSALDATNNYIERDVISTETSVQSFNLEKWI